MARPRSWAEGAWEPRRGIAEVGRGPGGRDTDGGRGELHIPLLCVFLCLFIFASNPEPPAPADTALRKFSIHFTFKSSNYVSQIVLIRRRNLQATMCGLRILVSWHFVSAGASDHMTFKLTVFGGLCNQQRRVRSP